MADQANLIKDTFDYQMQSHVDQSTIELLYCSEGVSLLAAMEDSCFVTLRLTLMPMIKRTTI